MSDFIFRVQNNQKLTIQTGVLLAELDKDGKTEFVVKWSGQEKEYSDYKYWHYNRRAAEAERVQKIKSKIIKYKDSIEVLEKQLLALEKNNG